MVIHGIDWPSMQHDSMLLRCRILWAEFAERRRRQIARGA